METCQCFHFQLPWSMFGSWSQVPKRSSPFWILVPLSLQTLSIQPAWEPLEISRMHVSHAL